MSVAQYYPLNGTKNRLRMGLSSILASEWIQYEDDFSERILEKKNLIHQNRDRVIQSVEGSQAAQYELLENILSFVKQYKSDLFTVKENSIISHSDKNTYDFSDFKSNPLELISYLAIDDFCLLDRCGDDYRLTAATVCAPTYWELAEKIGRPMKEVHGPIVNLEEKIGRMIRHFFINLESDDYYQRSNWFLMTTPNMPLFKDEFEVVDDINEHNIMDKLYLRTERQSFRKLKKTEYIVFGIKIYVAPLSMVSEHTDIAEDLLVAIESMTNEQKKLLGIDFYNESLSRYLRNVL